jgi:hypothetical protein
MLPRSATATLVLAAVALTAAVAAAAGVPRVFPDVVRPQCGSACTMDYDCKGFNIGMCECNFKLGRCVALPTPVPAPTPAPGGPPPPAPPAAGVTVIYSFCEVASCFKGYCNSNTFAVGHCAPSLTSATSSYFACAARGAARVQQVTFTNSTTCAAGTHITTESFPTGACLRDKTGGFFELHCE